MEKGSNMKKMAVLVGCNYPNTPHELHGCINDVLSMQKTLVTRFGFDPTHIEILTDAQGSKVLPTGENIKKALGKMIDEASAGDVLFFHYSGHGTRIPSVKHHPFRKDEAIVPCDFNLITDVDFRELVNRLPADEGASFTIISDSCHSGGLIDKEKEQIGPDTVLGTAAFEATVKPKAIPFETIVQHLSTVTNINTADIGTHLLECFGSNASLRFLSPQDEQESLHPDAGVLLSGCQADETSADVSGGGDKKAYGAFSNALQMVLKENSDALSNKEIVMMARNVLLRQGIQQHPCLYCSDQNATKAFLCQPKECSSDM